MMLEREGSAQPGAETTRAGIPGDTQLALALLEGAVELHRARERQVVEAMAVSIVERACPGAAAALFEGFFDPGGVIGLRTAGPRWRTAERDSPAWLAAECGALARWLRTLGGGAGAPAGVHCSSSGLGAGHLVAAPVPREGREPAALVVAWPASTRPVAHVGALLSRFGGHLGLALARDDSATIGGVPAATTPGLEGDRPLAGRGAPAAGMVTGVARTAGPPDQIRTSRSTGAQGRRVLLVDDQAEVRQIVGDMLTVLGHTVCEAATGEEALQALAEARFDLMVTDWAMPGMSGLDLARAVSAGRPDVPVVLLTGWGAPGRREPTPGVALVLAKPVTLAALRDAIDRTTGPGEPDDDAGGEAA